MAPGARSKFGTPVFEPKVFRKQTYCIEGSSSGIVGTFRRPRSASAPGESCPPLVTPLSEIAQDKISNKLFSTIVKNVCLNRQTLRIEPMQLVPSSLTRR